MSRRPPGDSFEAAAPARNLSNPYPRYPTPMQSPAPQGFSQYSTYQSPFQMPAPFQAPYPSYVAPNTAALVSFREGIQIVDDGDLGARADTPTGADPKFISYNGAKGDSVPGLGAPAPESSHLEDDTLDSEVTSEDLHSMIQRNLSQNTKRSNSLTSKLHDSHHHHSRTSEEDNEKTLKEIRRKLEKLAAKHSHPHKSSISAPMEVTSKTNEDIIQEIRTKLEKLQGANSMGAPALDSSAKGNESLDGIRERLEGLRKKFESKASSRPSHPHHSRANRLTSGALSSLIRA